MRITIDTEVLQSEHLSLGEFLVLLMGYKDIDYKESLDSLINKGVIQPNLFNRMSVVLSDNIKYFILRTDGKNGEILLTFYMYNYQNYPLCQVPSFISSMVRPLGKSPGPCSSVK